MRNRRFARSLFGLTVIAGVAVWAACSSDATSPTGGANQDAGPSTDQDSGGDGYDASPTPKDASPADAGKDAAFTPPPTVIIDGGAEFEGGIACFQGGEVEEEPNDDRSIANILRTARCGLITMPDGGAVDGGDVDWMTFSWDASTAFRLYYEGQVHVVVDTDGMAPRDISQPGQSIDLHTGQPYYVQVTSNDGKSQYWKVLLKSEP